MAASASQAVPGGHTASMGDAAHIKLDPTPTNPTVSQDDVEKGPQTARTANQAGLNQSTHPSTFSRFKQRITRQKTTADDQWDLPDEQHQNPEDYPPGYPRLAAHISSETNTHLYRRFGYLRTRSLLYMQDELLCLERRLHAMDVTDSAEEPYRLHERAFDVEDNPKRQRLFIEINAKLKEYDDMILRQKEILAIRAASGRDWLYYARYLWQTKPLSPEDIGFIWVKSDMIDLYTHAESTWMRPMVEAVISTLPRGLLLFLFRKKQPKNQSGGGSQVEAIASDTQSLVDGRLELLFKILIVLLTVIMLLVPVALLYLLETSQWLKLVIVFIFIALFTTVTLFLTQAKRNEVFVSVATYTAVLVVFLGNLPSPTTS